MSGEDLGGARDTRVVDVVAAGQAPAIGFVGLNALASGDAHVARWAPEDGGDLGRSRGLAALAYADQRLLAVFAAAGRASGAAPNASLDQELSWVFPLPAFADELAWVVAARHDPTDSERPAAARELPLHWLAPSAPAREPHPVPTFRPRPSLASSSAVRGGASAAPASSPEGRQLRPTPSQRVLQGAVLAPRQSPAGAPSRGFEHRHLSGAVASGRGASFSGPTLAMPAAIGALLAEVAHAGRNDRKLQTATPRAHAQTALAAVSARPPAAVLHLEWSDRWLARFSGASAASLAALDVVAAATKPVAKLAPKGVYVEAYSGASDDARGPAAAPRAAGPLLPQAPATSPPGETGGRQAQTVLRLADDAVVSDEVFAAIARAAVPRRGDSPRHRDGQASAGAASVQRRVAAIASRAPTSTESVPAGAAASRTPTAVAGDSASWPDRWARGAPGAVHAGIGATLAASPVAAAVAMLGPLSGASSFDMRSLRGEGVLRAYLAGAFEMPSDAWAAGGATTSLALAAQVPPTELLAPLAVASLVGSAPPVATTPAEPLTSAPSPAAAGDSGRPAAAPEATPRKSSPASEFASGPLVANGLQDRVRAPVQSASSESTMANAGNELPLVAVPAQRQAMFAGAEERSTDALTGVGWGRFGAGARPGALGAALQSWAYTVERDASSLALDFVVPELLVAAQMFGFGPAEAAQAQRLALGGQPLLAALADGIDRQFLWLEPPFAQLSSAGAREGAPGRHASQRRLEHNPRAEAASRSARSVAGNPAAFPAVFIDAGGRDAASAGPGIATQQRASPLGEAEASPAASAVSVGTIAGGTVRSSNAPMEGRAAPIVSSGSQALLRRPAAWWPRPRGAVLWPAAAIEAFELAAEDAEAQRPLTLAALDVLAANAVAALHSLAVPAVIGAETPTAPGVSPPMGTTVFVDSIAAIARADHPTSRLTDGAEAGQGGASIALSTALRPVVERIYLELSTTPAGRSLSPAVRAAKALALAQQLAPGASAAQVRAAAACAVMPAVLSAATEPAHAGSGAPWSVAASAARTGRIPLALGEAFDDDAAAVEHRPALGPGAPRETLAAPAMRRDARSSAAAPPLTTLDGSTRAAFAGEGADERRSPAATPRAAASGTASAVKASAALRPAAGASSGAAERAGTWLAALVAPADTGSATAAPPRAHPGDVSANARRAEAPLVSLLSPADAGAQQVSGRSVADAAGAGASLASLVTPGASRAGVVAEAVATSAVPRAAAPQRSSPGAAIPSWFESAARRMFAGMDSESTGGISIAEMTLINAAPARHVSASPRGEASGSASAARQGSAAQPEAPDVDALAEEVYAALQRRFSIERERNGDPWL